MVIRILVVVMESPFVSFQLALCGFLSTLRNSWLQRRHRFGLWSLPKTFISTIYLVVYQFLLFSARAVIVWWTIQREHVEVLLAVKVNRKGLNGRNISKNTFSFRSDVNFRYKRIKEMLAAIPLIAESQKDTRYNIIKVSV